MSPSQTPSLTSSDPTGHAPVPDQDRPDAGPAASDERSGQAPGRVALGVAYRGQTYHGWQSQPDGNTVQDKLERALAAFVGLPDGAIVTTMCEIGRAHV